MPSLLIWSLCIKHHAVYCISLSCLSSLYPQEALSTLLLIVQGGGGGGKESSTYVKGAKNPLVIHMSRVYGVCMARGYIPLCYLDNSHQALALLGFNPAASGMALKWWITKSRGQKPDTWSVYGTELTAITESKPHGMIGMPDIQHVYMCTCTVCAPYCSTVY